MSNKAGNNKSRISRETGTQTKSKHSRRRVHAGNIVLAVLLVLWVCLIWFHSSRPAEESSKESGWLLSLAHNIFPFLTEHVLRKLAHVFEYAVLGVLSSLLFLLHLKTRNLLHRYIVLRSGGWLIAFGLAVPVIDEAIQLLTPGRSAEVLDVMIDFGGFAGGTLITAAIFYLAYRRKY